MKKFVSLFLALCLVVLMVPALAEADFTGTWYLVTLNMNGSLIENPAAMGLNMSFTLNEDGTAVASNNGETTDSTWSYEDGKLIIDDLEMVINEDGTITADMGESGYMIFSRVAPEAEEIKIADPNPDAALEDYAGTWICKYVSVNNMTLDIQQIPLEQIGATEIPGLEIEGANVKMTGLDSLAGSESLEMAFEDGTLYLDLGAKLKEVLGSSDLDMTIKIQMLQDGMISLEVNMGMTIIFVFTPAAEAEEAPAA